MLGVENILVGLLIGMFMSIPFGPVGVIGIKRTLARGGRAGMLSGLGVALGDAFFAIIAIFGVAWLSNWLLSHQTEIQIVGGVLMAIIGVAGLFRYQDAAATPETTTGDAVKNVLGMALMTMANPQTILGFSAIFAATRKFYALETSFDAILLIFGVFIGSSSWWVALSLWLDRMRGRLNARTLFLVHQGAAMLIAILGIGLVIYAFFFGDDAQAAVAS